MANVFVVRSLVHEQFIKRILDAPVDPCDIANMVRAYKEKIKKNADERMPPLGREHRIEAQKEYLAMKISFESIDIVRLQKGCKSLVALFSVEPDKNRNTVILMGLDEDGELLRDLSGEFGQAEETWPVHLPVNVSDDEFDRFFQRTGPPCP